MRLLIASLLIAAAPAAFAQDASAPVAAGSAALVDASGASAGSVSLHQGPKGVVLRFEATGLTPGWHGLHFHEKGACEDAAAGFKASGKHAGHGADVKHGLLNAEGPEFGDLPNIHAAADGSANAEIYVEGAKVADLVAGEGTAIIVHANADDHVSQPIGGAGDRVACGVIKAN